MSMCLKETTILVTQNNSTVSFSASEKKQMIPLRDGYFVFDV